MVGHSALFREKRPLPHNAEAVGFSMWIGSVQGCKAALDIRQDVVDVLQTYR